MIRKSLLTLSLILCIVIIFPNSVQAKVPLGATITAEGYVLMDMDSGKILASRNENTKYEPASITKVLTALIVIEKGNLKDKITITNSPTREEGSSIYLKEGEILTVEQLLYGLMLKSGNDAATALAEHISGSKEAFAKEMNKKAKELGAVNSNFTNPHGLNDNNHYTTPKDYALICRGAMKNPTFRKIVSTVTYEIPPTPQFPETRFFVNHNKLIATQSQKYDGANGIKTGFTKRSLHTFVGSATRGKTNLIVVTMKAPVQCYADTKALFDYGFANFETKTIVEKGKSIGNIDEKNKSDIGLMPAENISYLFEKDNTAKITNEIKYLDLGSFKAGTVVAKLDVKANGSLIKTVDLTANKEYKTKLDKSLEKFGITTFNAYVLTAAGILIGILLILLIFNVKIKRKKSNKRFK